MRIKKKRGIESLKARYGMMFVAPWVFGVALFVLMPLFGFLSYSFSDVAMTPEGLETTFVGLQHYREQFIEDPYYLDICLESLSSLFKSAPIVVALSMVLALVLNQRFKGRMFARAIFFLPVIIASSSVMQVMNSFNMSGEIASSAGLAAAEAGSEYMEVIDFAAILQKLNLPAGLNTLLSGYLSDTFNLLWSCGIQVLLFVAGLQTIPAQLYEVGKVEGITAWEEFWYVTVPMMGRVILLVVFYTLVELFVDKSRIVGMAIEHMAQAGYSTSAAMLWPYFLAVSVIIAVVMLLYNRFCLRKWE